MSCDYPYTGEDRIDTPHSYMYTPFAGEGFFAAHAADRASALAGLLTQCEATPAVLPGPLARAMPAALRDLARTRMPQGAPPLPAALNGQWFVAGPGAAPALPDSPADPLDTPAALATLLAVAAQDATRAWPWLEFFIHRFEVAKRLRAGYNHGPTLAEPLTTLAPYALLASALGLACRGSLDHKFLNTMLKLGDLISSARHRADRDPDTAGLCAAALALELLGIGQLMKTVEQDR